MADTDIPEAVWPVLETVRKTGRRPNGRSGGGVYRNRGGDLPEHGRYRKYDIDPKDDDGRRSGRRIVIDEISGRAWYTVDHYVTFVEIVGPQETGGRHEDDQD